MNLGQLKKIVFILPSLKAGGAERVLSYISLELHKYNYDITLIVLGFEKDKVYDIRDLNIVYLNKKRLITAVFPLLIFINKVKPSIVFSSIIHLNTLMGFIRFFFPKIKFIGREASVMSNMKSFSSRKNAIIFYLAKYSYRRLDAIVCQSNDMKMDFIDNFSISKEKLFVINNPITCENFVKTRYIKNENIIRFITVGRLSKEKGHKRILEHLAQIKSYDFLYTIIGSGPELNNIKNLINELKITDNVKFIPYSKSILDHLSKNDLFIQGSYVEGFPNALLESCSVGTPVLAFNAPGGTKEVVENGVNGFLVDDESAFFEVLNDFKKLNSFNENKVKLSVRTKFDSKKIVNQYLELINTI